MQTKLEIGSEVAGYRVQGVIGRGGMGTVYLVERIETGEAAALKVLAPELTGSEEFRRRFVREARYAKSLGHPHAVQVYDAGDVDGVLYIAMQYVPGRDLKALLTAEGRLSPARAVTLLGQIAGALDAAHANGTVHRDVKPENVIVDTDGDPESAYLSDFGLARNSAQDSLALTAPTSYVGTFRYVAPEQVIGRDEVDARADVYSLACVLLECVTGSPPYPGEREVEVLTAHIREPPPRASDRVPGLPAALDEVIVRAMSKDPAGRHNSCRELLDDAAAAIAEMPAEAPAPAPQVASAPGAAGGDRSVAVFEIVAGNAAGGRLEVADELLIGRQAVGPGALGNDTQLAGQHARIIHTDGCLIEDLGSMTGTYINGERIRERRALAVGDRIGVGTTTLVVREL